MDMRLVRRIVLVVGSIGCTLFTLALLSSVLSPGIVEKVAKGIIRHEVEKRINETVDALDSSFLVKKAEALSSGHAVDIAKTKRLLAQQLPARLASTIAEMQDLDCECRKSIETFIDRGFENQIASDSAIQNRLTILIRSRYTEVAAQIVREFRIFTGTNALVFVLLIVAVLAKRQANLHLLPAAVVLLAAASVTAYLYLFNQDWLHTLVFSDYVGLGYVGYLGGVFALLCDILFNRARVTANVLSSALSSVGCAFEVLPC